MELNIMNAAERSARSNSGVRSDFGEFAANGFQSELETALDSRSGIQQNGTDILGGYSEAFVAVSPKITEKIKNDPEYSAELSQKLNALLKRQGEDLKKLRGHRRQKRRHLAALFLFQGTGGPPPHRRGAESRR